MTVGSLFSGIAGLERGIERANPGARVIWQAEANPYCRRVLARHYPGVRCYEDVRHVDERAERPDVICGGFPCQPVSLAGKRLGKEDPRWLWPEFARIVACLRPSAVFIENVPGLRTTGLRDVLADLARLGFDAEWDYFTAAETGAPHIRRRLFLLAYADGFIQRQQPGWTGGTDRSDSVVASEHGEAGPASDSGSLGKREPLVQGTSFVAQEGAREAPAAGDRSHVPDSDGVRELQPERCFANQWRWVSDGSRWTAVPPVSGVDDGLPERLEREQALGNAVVQQQAELAWRELAGRARA